MRPALHVSRLLLAAFAKALLRLSELRLFPIGSHAHAHLPYQNARPRAYTQELDRQFAGVSRISENAVLNTAAKSSDTAPSKRLLYALDGWS